MAKPACAHGHHHHTHAHGHGHHHHHVHEGQKNILFAFLLNLFFCIVELVGGLLTGSVAILSDALHDFGDSLALGLAWYLEKLSSKGRDSKFSYGYKRFSLLSSLLISLLLIVGAVFVIKASVSRLFDPGEPNAGGMLWLAIFGLLINGLAAYRLGRGSSLSERAVRLHLLEDVLGWVAVLIVSVVMHFVYLPILDPLLSLGITGWLLYNVFFTLRDTLRIMMQGIPEGVDSEEFRLRVLALDGVEDVHDLHIWTLNGQDHIGSLHVVCKADNLSDHHFRSSIKQQIREIGEEFALQHLTIELDVVGEQCCMEHC